ncbi:unnamed protein product [Adineta steineri]|uniref:Uncharacterized protein n=1 Tax=Adineta steineri TaxID=433720 RepID=A0A815AA91_9BILA|nr:unnamed protein product [Adineta steineri]CAF1100903.1 unnamed protein product [Adineta steineri]CAF1178362.1 unnamed protein product [Adineta steineri]CAF1181110.1 unnamed protein product [Adineta steineri]CAF1253260.1 unnamed protein product [Adineta steineri]
MTTPNLSTVNDFISSGAIVAIILGSIFGLALCVGTIIIIICIIKHRNQSRCPIIDQMSSQQTYAYPHSWASLYPPETTSITNYPSVYDSPPPYVASTSDYVKTSYA